LLKNVAETEKPLTKTKEQVRGVATLEQQLKQSVEREHQPQNELALLDESHSKLLMNVATAEKLVKMEKREKDRLRQAQLEQQLKQSAQRELQLQNELSRLRNTTQSHDEPRPQDSRPMQQLSAQFLCNTFNNNNNDNNNNNNNNLIYIAPTCRMTLEAYYLLPPA